jgi:hypothetical protein
LTFSGGGNMSLALSGQSLLFRILPADIRSCTVNLTRSTGSGTQLETLPILLAHSGNQLFVLVGGLAAVTGLAATASALVTRATADPTAPPVRCSMLCWSFLITLATSCLSWRRDLQRSRDLQQRCLHLLLGLQRERLFKRY